MNVDFMKCYKIIILMINLFISYVYLTVTGAINIDELHKGNLIETI